MANIKTALFARAAGFSSLTALIGTAPCRFYPFNKVPQETATPYITYQKISAPRNHAMGADTKKVIARYQLDCWDPTQDGAETVAAQVKACFNRYRGTSDTIDEMWLDSERDLTELDATYAALFRVSLDFFVGYTES